MSSDDVINNENQPHTGNGSLSDVISIKWCIIRDVTVIKPDCAKVTTPVKMYTEEGKKPDFELLLHATTQKQQTNED